MLCWLSLTAGDWEPYIKRKVKVKATCSHLRHSRSLSAVHHSENEPTACSDCTGQKHSTLAEESLTCSGPAPDDRTTAASDIEESMSDTHTHTDTDDY